MFKKAILAAAVAACAMPALAQQQEGNWMVRARAVNLDMANKSDAGSGALTPALLPADAIRVNDKIIPEVDITYFITKNIAAELILTYPQKQSVNIATGPLAQTLGSFKHLPPTLTLQYHFLPDGQWRPYVGVGLNYTRISNVGLQTNTGANVGLESSSTGAALQAGFDLKVAPKVFINFDVKKIWIDSDVTLNGGKISHLKLDPIAIGIGVGYRF